MPNHVSQTQGAGGLAGADGGWRLYLVGAEVMAACAVLVAGTWSGVRLLRRSDLWRTALEGLLILYLGMVVAVTLFPVAVGFGQGEVSFNIVPGRSLLGIVDVGPGQITRQIFGNVAMFIPLGLLAPALWPRVRSLKGIVAFAVGTSMVIEAVQFAQSSLGFARWRAVDVDDVLLNVAGAAIGYVVWVVARALTNKRFNLTRRSA